MSLAVIVSNIDIHIPIAVVRHDRRLRSHSSTQIVQYSVFGELPRAREGLFPAKSEI